MHGLIHVVLKQFVLEKAGEDEWLAILSEAGLTDAEATFLDQMAHSDATTVKAAAAAAKVMGLSVEDALRAYGGFFAESVHKGGYLRMLQSMGDSLPDFIYNLNHMHMVLGRDMFRTAILPHFTTVTSEDPNRFRLSYYSTRGPLLAPVVEGVFPVLAARLFNVKVSMTSEPPEDGSRATWSVFTSPLEEEAPSPSPARSSVSGWMRFLGQWHAALSGCGALRCVANCCCDSGSEIEVPKRVKVSSAFSGSTETVKLGDDMRDCLVAEERRELDELSARVAKSDEPAELLMRAVLAGAVASSWRTLEQLDAANMFWSTNAGDARDYNMSQTSEAADFFVSHPWVMPDDWHDLMGSGAKYGDVKATELKAIITDVSTTLQCKWQDITLWIDKCCIPQRHDLMSTCVSLLEEFVQRCDGMIVLLTWHYFSRLWCVYEWAAFLVYHDPQHMHLAVDTFMRPGSCDRFVDAVANISVQRCQCSDEDDRRYLEQKVLKYYVSEDAFETFAKCTAIALTSAAIMEMASWSTVDYEANFLPWVQLAERLNQHSLARALQRADPVEWRQLAFKYADATVVSIGVTAAGWRTEFARLSDAWLQDCVLPELEELKARSVMPEILHQMKEKHSAIVSKRSSTP